MQSHTPPFPRPEFARGIGGLALAWLLNEDRLLAAPARPELEEPPSI